MKFANFKDALSVSSYYVYPASVAEHEGSFAATVKNTAHNTKYLAVAGEKASLFAGEQQGALRICPLTNENAKVLMELFPYTKPVSHRDHPFTMGLGDRLGLAAPGQLLAVKDFEAYKVFPVLAQQSIRELTLTHRTFEDVIAAAAFGVFEAGYKGGYGADGDHLKTVEEIRYAMESGCTMITLDCSAHINSPAALLPLEALIPLYEAIPAEIKAVYEGDYLNKELPLIGSMSREELMRTVVVFYKAIDHAIACYRYMEENKTHAMDFELSIDEAPAITSPQEHFIVADRLEKAGVKPLSVAPHFTGAFEKGIEYAGDLNAFASDFAVHQQIARHFGYKLSLHSGSDKFSVFSTVGRVTKGKVHVKTAGTNWLEAMLVIAQKEPALYRKAHNYALEMRHEAEKYYHVSTDVKEIPPIELQSDAFLPEYLKLPASRQSMHIAYGLLLEQDWFKDAFFAAMAKHESCYYENLRRHIGRHLSYLTAEMA